MLRTHIHSPFQYTVFVKSVFKVFVILTVEMFTARASKVYDNVSFLEFSFFLGVKIGCLHLFICFFVFVSLFSDAVAVFSWPATLKHCSHHSLPVVKPVLPSSVHFFPFLLHACV